MRQKCEASALSSRLLRLQKIAADWRRLVVALSKTQIRLAYRLTLAHGAAQFARRVHLFGLENHVGNRRPGVGQTVGNACAKPQAVTRLCVDCGADRFAKPEPRRGKRFDSEYAKSLFIRGNILLADRGQGRLVLCRLRLAGPLSYLSAANAPATRSPISSPATAAPQRQCSRK
jgi:hypothetical protein